MATLSTIIRKERVFVAALFGLLLLMWFSPGKTVAPVPMETGPRTVLSAPALAAALAAGKIPSPLLEMAAVLGIVFITILIAGLLLIGESIFGRKKKVYLSGIPPRVGWGVWPVVRLFVYFLFVLLVLLNLEGVLSRVGVLDRSPVLLAGNAVFQYGLILAMILAYLRRAGYPSSMLRLRPQRLGTSLRQAVRGYIFFFPILVGLMHISFQLNRWFGLRLESHPLVAPLLFSGHIRALLLLFTIGVAAAPLAEEVFFRGFFYPALKKRFSVPAAVVVSSLFFSTLHLSPGGWLPIMGLGVFLAFSYEKTGSLLIPVFIHAFHHLLFLTYTVLAWKLSRLV